MNHRDDAAYWACPHGQDARLGCVACYEDSRDPESVAPLWEVAVWFFSERPLPIKALQDVHRHGSRFLLDKLSAPHIYLLTAHVRAGQGSQAVAGLVGFLVHNRHVVDEFTVQETRAVLLSPPAGTSAADRVWPRPDRR
ncbi:hypothetical protein Sme01_13910 [Sphaerisporangium melleum]|uniref:Uncharacterized protein n=1 Tax=Sphaerisporangium melleum TaxID=321316 RepID=A0A917QU61_9ACTN|nr:hypothetical protein [Sphaerisporangium melleum]GGK68646.1 hypothetical protein GCM10007964_09510 [Sphaerisporangium melleum]GII68915.1 hypothetical protein Sme01_13910 [Sphaerisporangium melleum]